MVVCRAVPATHIDEATARSMFAIFERFYVGISWDGFLSDLREKTWVLLFQSGARTGNAGRIVGFSTVLRQKGLSADRTATFLFSGDTVVDPSFWRYRLLERAFFWLIFREKLRAPHRRLYWMLISKGYTTYRMLASNFPLGFPRHDAATPPALRRVLDAYYQARYGSEFDTGSGVIAFAEPHGALRAGVAESRNRTLDDPDVRYFVAHNPRWREGQELACIAQIRLRDFGRFALRAFRRARRRRTPRVAPAASAADPTVMGRRHAG
jgi:hypothetical protein